MTVDEHPFFYLLTDHEVYYAAVDTQRDDSHRSKINEHLGQKEDGSTIVATHILMTERLSIKNIMAIKSNTE